MAVTISLIIKDGEEILTQATQEVTKDFTLQEFLNKTIPGWEETIHAFMDKVDNEYVPRFKVEAEHIAEEVQQVAGVVIKDIHGDK